MPTANKPKSNMGTVTRMMLKLVLIVTCLMVVSVSYTVQAATPQVLLQVGITMFVDGEGRAVVTWNRVYENTSSEPIEINDSFGFLGHDYLTVTHYWLFHNQANLTMMQEKPGQNVAIMGVIPPGKTYVSVQSEYIGPWNTISFGWMQQKHHLSLNLFSPRTQSLVVTDFNSVLMLSREATVQDAHVLLGTEAGQIRVDPTESSEETSIMQWHSKAVDGTLWAGFNLDYILPYRNRQVALGLWALGLLGGSNVALWFTFRQIRRSTRP